jgi:hypothetical protein
MPTTETTTESDGTTYPESFGEWHKHASDDATDDYPRYVCDRRRMDGGALQASITEIDGELVFYVGNLDELRRETIVTETDVSNLEAFAQRWLLAHPAGFDPSHPEADKWQDANALKVGACTCDPIEEDWHLLKSPQHDAVAAPVYECQTCGEVFKG